MDVQIRPEPGAAGARARQRISGRAVLLSLGVLLANIVVNGLIFPVFFRDSTLHPLLTAVLAVLWGVLGVYLIYYTLTWAVEQYPDHVRSKVLPYVFLSDRRSLFSVGC
ncbi:hypothetical protein ACFSQ7_03440 [Paenibacillus rhizoplanae]